MNGVYLYVSLTVAIFTLGGMVLRLLTRGHKILSRIDDVMPTLERIAKAFPGRRLEQSLHDVERAIDGQSQELMRLGRIVDRRRDPQPHDGPERRRRDEDR